MNDKYRYVIFQWSVETPEEITEEDESRLLHLVCEDEENAGMEVFNVSVDKHGFAGFIPQVDGEFLSHHINIHVKTHLKSNTDHYCLDKDMVEMVESRVREVLPEAAQVGSWHILLRNPEPENVQQS